MPDWLISTPNSNVWKVWLGDCTREHAESVMASLESDPSVPNRLHLEQRQLHDLPFLQRKPRLAFWRR